MLYDIIPGDLCIAVLGLFEVLSRIGNVGNDTFRLPTTLHHCNRLHALAVPVAKQVATMNWEDVPKVVGIGDDADMLCDIVEKWSGGPSASCRSLKTTNEFSIFCEKSSLRTYRLSPEPMLCMLQSMHQ